MGWFEYGEEVYAVSKDGIPAKIAGIPWIDFLLFAKKFGKIRLCLDNESRNVVYPWKFGIILSEFKLPQYSLPILSKIKMIILGLASYFGLSE